MIYILLLFIFGNPGRIGYIEDRTDLVEINHKFDRNDGKHIFDQVIFWERRPENGKYRVRGYVMVEDREDLNRRPKRVPGGYEVIWLEGERLHRLFAPIMRESWTDYDPEQEDARKWPSVNRNMPNKGKNAAK